MVCWVNYIVRATEKQQLWGLEYIFCIGEQHSSNKYIYPILYLSDWAGIQFLVPDCQRLPQWWPLSVHNGRSRSSKVCQLQQSPWRHHLQQGHHRKTNAVASCCAMAGATKPSHHTYCSGAKNGCFQGRSASTSMYKKCILTRLASSEKKFHRNQGNSYGQPGESCQQGWQKDIRNMGGRMSWKEEDGILKSKKNKKKSVSRWDPKKLASAEIFFISINWDRTEIELGTTSSLQEKSF